MGIRRCLFWERDGQPARSQVDRLDHADGPTRKHDNPVTIADFSPVQLLEKTRFPAPCAKLCASIRAARKSGGRISTSVLLTRSMRVPKQGRSTARVFTPSGI